MGTILYPNHFKAEIEVDGQMVEITKHVGFPIKWNNLLDERLDEATIGVMRTKREIFHPMTKVRIYLFNENEPDNGYTLSMLVAQDSVQQKIVQGRYVWNHEMRLIEETKLLEGFVCRSQGYVNSLGRDYTANPYTVIPTVNSKGVFFTYNTPAITNPKAVGKKYSFPSLRDVFGNKQAVEYTMTVNLSNKAEPVYTKTVKGRPLLGGGTGYVNAPDDVFTTTIENGTYTVRYYGMRNSANSVDINYLFNAVTNKDPLPKWNARTVIERALAIAEPLRKGDTPRFKLNEAQAAEFEKIETPEFQFTQSTLKEVLQGVGAYVHGEPRLIGDTIYYDMYGSDELNEVKYTRYATLACSQGIEDYATALDSSVDNFVNSFDAPYATMTEPYTGGFKTVRTEKTFARIEEGNMFIETKYPIYSIKRIRCGGTVSTDSVDITSYIFESSEYARMSSYIEQYPASKAYALYYTQGEKNIQGLTFKIPNVTNGVFANYAIVNILKAVSGVKPSIPNYAALAFEIEYTPIFSARVQQSKQYIGDFKYPRTLIYNQGQNVVESQYYGENMKGAIARLGNVDKTYTIVMYGLAPIPKIGTLWNDDYYISSVAVQVDFQTTTITLGLSQDFNRLSQYIGINSTKRFYEVSERQAFDSQLSYRDYAVIGDKTDGGDALFNITDIARTFDQSGDDGHVSLLLAKGEDANGGELAEIALPVQTFALGNSAVLTTKYEDNYSAGNDSVHQSSGNVTGQFTNAVPYGDLYGNIEYLNLNYYEKGTQPQNLLEQTDIGNSLPSAEQVNGVGKHYLTTGNKPLWVKKGSTEILSVTYQVDFVTNRRNIIIGSALAKNNILVSGTQSGHSAALYVLPKRLNKLKLVADLTGATLVKNYADGGISVNGNSLVFDAVQSPVSGQAWVMVDQATGEVLLGCNKEITPESADILDGLHISSKHQLF